MIKKKSLINLNVNAKISIVSILALLAGFVNGFLGTGGGIILMFALSLTPAENDNAVRDRFATLIAVILPLSLISVFTYGDSVNLSDASQYILPGILGGVTGAILLDKLNVKIVKKLFAIMIIWAGINFLR